VFGSIAGDYKGLWVEIWQEIYNINRCVVTICHCLLLPFGLRKIIWVWRLKNVFFFLFWCGFDRASSIICGNKMSTIFYFHMLFSSVYFVLHDITNTAPEELPINCSAHYFLKCLFYTWSLFARWHYRSAAVVNTEVPAFLEKSVKLLLLSFTLRQVNPEEAQLWQ
jgi:hypothetical protein